MVHDVRVTSAARNIRCDRFTGRIRPRSRHFRERPRLIRAAVSFLSFNGRPPLSQRAKEEERGRAKLYLTRRVKGRSLARARVPDYVVHERGSRSPMPRRMSILGFAEMCIAPLLHRGSLRPRFIVLAFTGRESPAAPIYDSKESSRK